ncbi:MAG: amidohydrolase family protein [Flavobacteriaceae bacterium]
MKKGLLFICLLFGLQFYAQEHFPKNDGVKTPQKGYTAFTNATITVSPKHRLKNATLIIKNNKIIDVGTGITIPKNATIVDLNGLFIYPSFIDLYSEFGVKKPEKAKGKYYEYQWDSKKDGYYWNDHMKPQIDAIDSFKYDKKEAKKRLDLGFGTVNTHSVDGIARGTSLLTCLNDKVSNNERIIEENATQHFAFKRSIATKQSYPGSLMGMMALLRQYYNDVAWYKNQDDVIDLSLQAQIDNSKLPSIIYAGDKLNDLRAHKISNQFNLDYIIVGGGNEFERIEEIKNTNARYIIPINFPKPYDVTNPFFADKIALSDLRFWNQAPSNPAVLAKHNVDFCLTASSLKEIKDFRKNLLKAIEYGLDKNTALAALTTTPARYLGKENEIGSLKKGAYANFLISSKPIFDKDNVIYENWTLGQKNVINDRTIIDITGDYSFSLENKKYSLKLSGKLAKLKAKVLLDSTELKSKVSYKNNWLNLMFNPLDSTKMDFIRLIAKVNPNNKNLKGKAVLENGEETTWFLEKDLSDKKKETKKDKKKKKEKETEIFPTTYPNIAYGFKEKAQAQNIIIKNVTVWTNENEGIVKNKDVIIKKGKIYKIENTNTYQVNDDFIIIDGTGKHLTSGIIDEHSHIAISNGVNEGGQNNSAEVTIQDVVKSDDINIYRNLAGGVTTSQLLHGSANPIGGRAALVKWKWGENPETMQYKDHKFIKFALGENVKHSRTPFNSHRFPQTRMGVEQVYIDNFTRAKEYDTAKKQGKNPRYDQELEVLAEILNKERFITCHSYVQSEITMLMRVAERFNFRVNTFTHILEGYKVADKMKKHGVGASTFSDWWAYKYEVNDAIPYNGVIMHNKGITVAFNSDDAEMSRRLNQEAAKAVKYGGVSEEAAWKFVTLNPAILLHIDDKVGSVKIGKDADVVLWSDNPLSVYAKAEKTIIEGTIYFDIERDLEQQNEIRKERNKLINLMLVEKNEGIKTQQPKKKETKLYHCDSEGY